MRSGKNYTILASGVHDRATGIFREHVQLRDHGHPWDVSVSQSILFFAASRRNSIDDACLGLRHAPSGQAVHGVLHALLLGIDEPARRLNASLSADLPRPFRKRPQRLSIDLSLIPCRGEPRHQHVCPLEEKRLGQLHPPRSPQRRKATVQICVACRDYRGRSK
jgi:hypothetical protein